MSVKISKINKDSQEYRKFKIILLLLGLIKPYKLYFAVNFLLISLGALLALVPTYIMKPMVDKVFIPGSSLSLEQRLWTLGFLVVLLLAAYLLSSLVNTLSEYRREWLGEKVTMRLKQSLFIHLQRLSIKFYNLTPSGDIYNRMGNDTQQINSFIVDIVPNFFISLVTCLGIGIILFSLELRLALLVLVPVPVVFVLSRIFSLRLRQFFRVTAQKASRLNSLILRNISSAMVVKTNIAERSELAKFKKAIGELFTKKMQQAKINVLLFPSRRMATLFSLTMIYFIGGRDVINGNLTLGALMVFIGYVRLFYGPIGSISTVFTFYQKMAVSAERILKVLDTQPDVVDAPDAISLSEVRGHVKFNNVSFSYDDEKKVLREVNFEAMPGEIIGIIGPSGSGKSTLMHLLCRLYDVTGGSIMLDGHNISDIKINSLRKQIAVILQDTLLFYATIAENIAYAKPQASRDEIVAATKAAGAHNFIMRLPDAYDTIIGESGAGLSEGEKQRIAIARALLRDLKIIIFDEATSALDSESEAVIYATIKKLSEKHTIFVISHRVLALNELADKVLAIKNGRISELDDNAQSLGEQETAGVSVSG